ncbi:Ig-like domain repeat protein [Streptomyces sp. NPDC005529]|uniref:Ig-like domain repeat protein n=1 Tax=unclassified Streptomyces TaxID=2593676 RepID=UPI0033B00D29
MERQQKIWSILAASAVFAALPGIANAAAGDLDQTFGDHGKVTVDLGGVSDFDTATAMVLQPDGKIVTAGYAGINSSDTVVARFNPDGSPDTTFSGDGRAVVDLSGSGSDDVAYAVALQPDGKIVTAGQARAGSRFNTVVARFNTDGSLDTTFSGDGSSDVDVSGTGKDDVAYAVALQPDGKIVTAGDAVVNSTTSDTALARFNADGSPDTTFSDDGHTLVDLTEANNSDMAYGVAIQSDGRIVTAGKAQSPSGDRTALARFTADGSLDTTFSDDGHTVAGLTGTSSDWAHAVALRPDGKIVTAGEATFDADQEGQRTAVAQFNTDGSPDTTFSEDGNTVVALAGGGGDLATALALEPDGKIVTAGAAVLTNTHTAVARFNADGSPDTTFSDEGHAIVSLAGDDQSDSAYAVALQPDGKIVTAGSGGVVQGEVSQVDTMLGRFEGGGLPTTTTTLTTGPNPAVAGEKITLTATVTGSSPTGTVTFKDGTTTLGTASLINGKATFSTTKLGQGPHSLTAVYAGSATNAGSTSAPTTENVDRADVKVAVTAAQTSTPSAVTLTYTLKVTNNGPTTAHGVKVGFLTPPGMTVTATSPTATSGVFTYNNTSYGKSWNLGDLPPGTTTITITATAKHKTTLVTAAIALQSNILTDPNILNNFTANTITTVN